MSIVDLALIKTIIIMSLIMGSFIIWVTIDNKKRWVLYDAKQLRKDKNNDRYIRHFIIWLKNELKKEKFKYQEVRVKGNKKFKFGLVINNYKCIWAYKNKNDFREYLEHIKEGILVGKQIIRQKEKNKEIKE